MKEKKRILFVDDQPNILSGLKRMLHKMHNEWDMQFYGSGKEALAVMEKQSFDLVVADMMMPEMNGAQLLKEVAELYPGTIRYILSGHSDRELVLQSVGCAHQYIAKPCEPETLRHHLQKSLRLREGLSSETLHSVIARIRSLPSPPEIYNEIITLLQNEESSLNAVAKAISKDISLTTKLLQIVNSAFFGLPTRVDSAEQAVNHLGLNTVQGLVLSAGIYSQIKDPCIPGISIESLYTHSMAIGTNAKKIASEIGLPERDTEDAFLAGLLHDIGKLVMISNFKDEMRRVISLVKEKSTPLHIAEKEVFGVGHAEIGSHLLSLWGFPDPILEVVAYHHDLGQLTQPTRDILTAVYIANTFYYHQQISDSDGLQSIFNTEYLEKLDLLDKLPHLQEYCVIETTQEGVII